LKRKELNKKDKEGHTDEIDNEPPIGATCKRMMKVSLAIGKR
jgi:hypothetical protein